DASTKAEHPKSKVAAGAKTAENAKKTTVTVAPAATPVATPTPTPAATPTPATTPTAVKKKTELTGSHLGVMVEQNGQVVEQVSAEINLPQLLATVFSTTRRDRGEIPFAIGKDGKIYTPSDDDRKTIEAMKLPAPTSESKSSTTFTKGD